MSVHRFVQSQALPITREEAWAFLSDPNNLPLLMPRATRFRIVTGGTHPIREGQIIVCRFRAAPLVDLSWITEIKAITPGVAFIDEQRLGPYRFWHHRHSLEAREDHTVMHDEILYALPFGLVGDAMHALFARRQLAKLFRHRERVLRERFGIPEGAR